MSNSLKYTIARGSSSFELAKEVNELIAQGWHPQGGVACEGAESDYIFQALVREGDQRKEKQ